MSILLLRHPPVARAWAGRCYGSSDMGWSREGARLAARLVAELPAVEHVVHSGLVRTRRLAEAVARRRCVPVTCDPRWRERDFGAWEGRRWDAIWRDTGDEMDRMMTDPEQYRPGGGETGRALADRAIAAWHALPASGRVLVVAHGGPIAAVRCLLAGAPLEAMVHHVPACGEIVALR